MKLRGSDKAQVNVARKCLVRVHVFEKSYEHVHHSL